MKPLELFSLLPRRPEEFLERASAIISSRWERWFVLRPLYLTLGVEKGVGRLLDALGPEAAEGFDEAALARIESRVEERQAALPADAPFARFHNGDTQLGRLCYAAARSLRPKAVVETGVCYGVTTSHLLAALEANGEGLLHSVDLPPLGKSGDDYVGWLVPEELRGRWRLHRGTSSRLLRPLVGELGQIDLFVHDSLHTYRNMRNEFSLAWPALRPGGVLISDDIEGNKAFQELSELPDVAVSVVIKEENKGSLLGVAVKKR